MWVVVESAFFMVVLTCALTGWVTKLNTVAVGAPGRRIGLRVGVASLRGVRSARGRGVGERD